MSQAQDLGVRNTKIVREEYGLASKKPFQGMVTVPFYGMGEQVSENMQIESGFYRKMYGNSLFSTVAITAVTINDILYIWEYDKGDGTYQRLCVVKTDTAKWKIRGITDAGALIVPTGGAGDVEFTSGTFDYVQLGLTGYIVNKSATTQMYSWNGTLLTAVSNCPANPEWITTDGQRLVVSAAGIVSFSGRNYGVISDFTAGTGVDMDGNYTVSNPGAQRAGIQAGGGVVIFFPKGAEYHKVTPNNNGDGLSGETRYSSWNYNGLGPLNQQQVCTSDNWIYIVNSDGLIQISPLTGESVNLIEGSGAAQKLWRGLDYTSMVIEYDKKELMVVISFKKDGDATNDKILCYHIPYKAFYVKTDIFAKSLGMVNNQLYAGNEGSGRVYKVFDNTTYLNGQGGTSKCRIIKEWEGSGNPKMEKRLTRYGVMVNMNPNSDATVNLYKDGYTSPITGTTITQADLTNSSSGVGVWGAYTMGVGTGDTTDNSDAVKAPYFTTSYGTITIGIEEDSTYDFRVYSMLLQLSPIPTSEGGKLYLQNSYANSSF